MNLYYNPKNLLLLEEMLNQKIFGQEHVIKSITDTLKIRFVGLSDDEKPIGSFLFSGSTGVGKTELAIELCNAINMNFVRFDMSEYSIRHNASNLIGTSKGLVGYEEGGLLTNTVKKNPMSIILFDEIEKAHPSIFHTFLQILDYGILTDTQGEKISFARSIIIFTTNLGADDKKSVGFNSLDNKKNEAIQKFFTPEFIARLNSIHYFNELSTEMVENIVCKFLSVLSSQLFNQGIHITYHRSAINKLIQKGLTKKKGARGINQTINEEIKTYIANGILSDFTKNCNSIYIYVENEQFEIIYTKNIRNYTSA